MTFQVSMEYYRLNLKNWL